MCARAFYMSFYLIRRKKMWCAQKDAAEELNTNMAFKTIISMLGQEIKQNDPRRVQP